jgi:selenocysteine-specific elongation factor
MLSRGQSNGLKRSELRSQTLLDESAFDFLLQRLVVESKLRLDGEYVFLASNSSVADSDSEWLKKIASEYESAGLATPAPADVAARLERTDADMRRLVTLLLRDGTLIRMGAHEVYIHQTPLEGLRSKIRELRGQTLDVTRFKQLTSLSRKYAIPLLEYLDRERITRKNGDQRVVL